MGVLADFEDVWLGKRPKSDGRATLDCVVSHWLCTLHFFFFFFFSLGTSERQSTSHVDSLPPDSARADVKFSRLDHPACDSALRGSLRSRNPLAGQSYVHVCPPPSPIAEAAGASVSSAQRGSPPWAIRAVPASTSLSPVSGLSTSRPTPSISQASAHRNEVA
jgi:hypothetical protein